LIDFGETMVVVLIFPVEFVINMYLLYSNDFIFIFINNTLKGIRFINFLFF